MKEIGKNGASLQQTADSTDAVRFTYLPGAHRPSALAQDTVTGLSGRPKSLPAKYFYDARGSTLFERICATPEYYPTRTEDALLRRHSRGIVDAVRPRALIDLGSGSSRKTCQLFSACEERALRVHYQPFDVCAEALREASSYLMGSYPWLRIEALVGDYGEDLAAIPPVAGPRLFLFLGGTLGNLTDTAAQAFLRRLRGTMRANDALLLGFDRVKDKAVLDAAYNDSAGLTAAFNLNVLKVLNERLDGDFRYDGFRHEAFFLGDRSRVEMHLVARHAHKAFLRKIDMTVAFDAGESILTEISRKFTQADIETLLARTGFRVMRHDQPDNGYYSLVLAATQPSAQTPASA